MLVSKVTLALVLMTSASMAAPHILLMILDDIGRADTGIYGQSNINLPNLKNLAREGVVFENFYTQTVCSPTRSSLLTGLYPFRFGMQHLTTQFPAMIAGIPLDTPILPALLADKGYERELQNQYLLINNNFGLTVLAHPHLNMIGHMIGKWHCGYATWSHTPTGRGFQSYTGYLQGQGDYYKHNFAIDQLGGPFKLWKNVDGLDFWQNRRPYKEVVGNYSVDVYRDAMIKVLRGYASRHQTREERAEHPLFIYMAHQTVHIPLQYKHADPRCDSIKHPVRKIYCYMLFELDEAVKEMVQEYKALGMWDDLLILTLTDNGGMVNFAQDKNNPITPNYPTFGASQGSNYPLRGSKATLFDGGVRSTAFASGGIIPKESRGRRLDVLAHAVDFSATVLEAANIIPVKKEKLGLDGHSLLGLILDKPGASSPRDHVPINIVLGGKRYSAVRFGDYKFIVDDFTNTDAQGWFDENGDLKESSPPNQKNRPKGSVSLYNLKEDPYERRDIAGENPNLVQYGRDLINMYIQSGNYLEPQESSRLRVAALPFFHGGSWKPWMDEKEWTAIYEHQKAEQQKRLKETGSIVVDDPLLKDFSIEYTFDGELPDNEDDAPHPPVYRDHGEVVLIHDVVETSLTLRQNRVFKD